MIVIVALIGLSVAIEVAVAWKSWPPRSGGDRPTAWLLFALGLSLIFYDVAILLATIKIPVPPIPALLLLLFKATAMGWWLWAIRQARRSE